MMVFSRRRRAGGVWLVGLVRRFAVRGRQRMMDERRSEAKVSERSSQNKSCGCNGYNGYNLHKGTRVVVVVVVLVKK